MSENVVPFPERPATSIRREREREEHQRQEAARRIAALRKKIAKRPTMTKPTERKVVARHLWDILDRVEKENGVKKSKVLHEAGHGSATDSTKRLPLYALRPDLPDEEVKRRSKKLTQDARKYVKIVEKAAELIGRDRDHFLLRLFRGSGYSPEDEDIDKEPDEPYLGHMEAIIHEMAAWIRRNNPVDDYFKALRDEPYVNCDDEGNFTFDPHWKRVTSPDVFCDSEPIVVWDVWKVGYVPRILLYRRMLSSADGEFVHWPEGWSTELEQRLAERDDYYPSARDAEALFSKRGLPTEAVVIETWRELSLALVPPRPDAATGPAFEKRFLIQVRRKGETQSEHMDDGLARVVEFHILSESRKARDEWNYIFFADDEGGDVPGFFRVHRKEAKKWQDGADIPSTRSYFYESVEYAHVDLVSCQKYLSVDTSEKAECSEEWCRDYDMDRDGPCVSPPDTVAACIELNLHNPEERFRIDALLNREVARRCALLAAHRRSIAETLEKRKKGLFARWSDSDDAAAPE